ncbi:hypothetical protein ACFXJ8_32565 [Nonomuraea sp. NPDC059194]|uniref:hypothetical protein n=1 Tax=Nonomuraea sp. NPDC059194 TaxID=3346764 RepID=UPI0036991A96
MPPGRTVESLSDKLSQRIRDLTTEELAALNQESDVIPSPSWTRDEYWAQMLARGVAESGRPGTAGIDGYLALADEFGVLEKRPNTLWADGESDVKRAGVVM